jgi:hypothetical protein
MEHRGPCRGLPFFRDSEGPCGRRHSGFRCGGVDFSHLRSTYG